MLLSSVTLTERYLATKKQMIMKSVHASRGNFLKEHDYKTSKFRLPRRAILALSSSIWSVNGRFITGPPIGIFTLNAQLYYNALNRVQIKILICPFFVFAFPRCPFLRMPELKGGNPNILVYTPQQ